MASKPKCWIKSDGQCCCNCVHNWQTAPGARAHKVGKKCRCYQPDGWACVHPEIHLVMPNTKHSIGCECYTPKDSIKEAGDG